MPKPRNFTSKKSDVFDFRRGTFIIEHPLNVYKESEHDDRIMENFSIMGESWYFYVYFRPLSVIFQKGCNFAAKIGIYAGLNYWSQRRNRSVGETGRISEHWSKG